MLLALSSSPSSKPSAGPSPARLTIISAALTLNAKFPERAATPLLASFDDPRTFDRQERYQTSKLLAHMFMWNLVDYVSADDVIVNLADLPGSKAPSSCATAPGLLFALRSKSLVLRVARPGLVRRVMWMLLSTRQGGAWVFFDELEHP
ncbi:hypothetical protein B0H67DRAFT_595868, partial [Lasiosphaeris hirsuta]